MFVFSRNTLRNHKIVCLDSFTKQHKAATVIALVHNTGAFSSFEPARHIMNSRSRGIGGRGRFSGGALTGAGGGFNGSNGSYGNSFNNFRGHGYNNTGYGAYSGGRSGFSGGFPNDNGMGSFNASNNMPGSDMMQLMNAMASNFHMNPPPPPPSTAQLDCGELRAHHAGLIVELTGRLVKKRVSRFVELRDRNGGAIQVVILEDQNPRLARRIQRMPESAMLTIVGKVTRRPPNSCNQSFPTGEVEVELQDIVNICYAAGLKRPADKRTYSSMARQGYIGITSTEYKFAKGENILKYFENRDITCNDLRSGDVGKTVSLVGWIPPTKNSKFIQLKDGYGQTQIVINDQTMQDTCLTAPQETLIQITGKVLARPPQNINEKYDTGEVEVMVESVKILNPDDPYEGPIKSKEKVQKMSITDLDAEENKTDSSESAPKNGNAAEVANSSTTVVQERIKVADTNKFADRTHNCGELGVDNIGEKVIICGWLEFQRMGKFFILRDGYGQTQVLLTEKTKNLQLATKGISLESIVRAEGTVIPRPSCMVKETMKTGQIEVDADLIEVLNPAKANLPFEVRKFNRAGERLRLTHRYLDLRFTDMQRNLRMRSAVIMRMREYLINYLGFVEVETPTLFRRTPGGAQEFVVPTRKAGHFYSLVQSPQQFKQMLMAGGIDRYFQVARCYRDEATRPDRQPEFTQLDIELSFTSREDVMQLVEELLQYSWPNEFPKVQIPFRRMTYEDAMEKYGTDKPDLRCDTTLNNVTDIIEKNDEFQKKFGDLGAYAIVIRGSEAMWNPSARKHYEELSKKFGGTLFVRKITQYQDLLDRLEKLLGSSVVSEIIERLDIEETDLLFLAIGEKVDAQTLMGRIRIDYHNFLIENGKTKNRENKFLWVIDFPMFLRNPQTSKLESVHHPFTAPHQSDLEKFMTSKGKLLEKLRSQAYDLVLNGQEIGGGSIRIHDRDMQQFVLERILKIPHEHLEHLLNALESGCPPHGGIALGLDRLVAIICRAASIRDVIAFPKSLNGRDPLSKAPVPISEEEKAMYHIAVIENAEVSQEHPLEDDDPETVRASPSPQPDDICENIKTEVTDTDIETVDEVPNAEAISSPKKETHENVLASEKNPPKVPSQTKAARKLITGERKDPIVKIKRLTKKN